MVRVYYITVTVNRIREQFSRGRSFREYKTPRICLLHAFYTENNVFKLTCRHINRRHIVLILNLSLSTHYSGCHA